MKKLIDKYEGFEGREHHFNWAFLVFTMLFVAYLIIEGRVDFDTVIGMGTGIIFNVSILLMIGFGLQKFQLGSKRDIQKEIFDQNNIAASIYQAGIWIALGMVISKGLM